jgi:hypothetical protein
MSVSTVEVKERYTGRGDTGPYALPFETLLDAGGNARYSKVAVRNSLGQESDITAACTVSGKNIYTGEVYDSTYTVVVYREVPYTQPASFPLGGSTTPRTYEEALDRTILQVQQLQEQLTRAMKAAVSEEASQLTLPPKETRPNTFLSFDDEGNVEVQPGPPPRYWNPEYHYKITGKLILHNGKLWKFVAGSDQGTEPGTDGEVWEEVPLSGEWNDSYTFALNAITSYGGILYNSLQSGNKGHRPDISPSWWTQSSAMSDADTVDGEHASAFADAAHTHPGSDVTSQVGDADTVDGEHASSFANAVHTHPGGDVTSQVGDADTVDGKDASAFAPAVRLCQRSLSNTNYAYSDSGIVPYWKGENCDLIIGASFGSWDVDGQVFTISESGVYEIEACISSNSTGAGNRTTVAFEIQYDVGGGWGGPFGATYGYIRDTAENTKLTTTIQKLVRSFVSGDKVRTYINRYDGSATLETATNGSWIIIRKLGD